MINAKHIYLSLYVLLVNFGSALIADIRWADSHSFHYFRYFFNLIPPFSYHVLAAVPLLFFIYWIYNHPDKNKFYQWMQIILLPLIGALILPAFFYLLAEMLNNGWVRLGGTFLLINNLILYFLNELLLFWNLRKIKSAGPQ